MCILSFSAGISFLNSRTAAIIPPTRLHPTGWCNVAAACRAVTSNSSITLLGKGCRQSTKYGSWCFLCFLQTCPADVYRIIQARRYQAMKNIVLVHGGFVDGAGWEGVYKILKGHGYKVSIVQNPTISLEDDVAVTKRILATQDAGQWRTRCHRLLGRR